MNSILAPPGSRETLLAILNQVHDAVFLHEVDGRIIYVNQTMLQIYRVSADEALGFSIAADYSSPENPNDQLKSIWERVIAGESQLFEWKARRPHDGSLFDVEVFLTRMRLQDRNVILATVRDISERKLREEALKSSESELRALFEQAAVGVGLAETRTGRFVKVNQKYCDIVGYTREEMLKLSFHEITHPDDHEVDRKNVTSMLKGELREFSREKRYFHKNGNIVWINLTVSPMWAIGEDPRYNIVVIEDITERKLAEQALRREQEFNRALLENIVDGVVACDANGRLAIFNRTAREWHGMEALALLPERWSAYYDLFDSDGITPLPTESIPLRRAFNGEHIRDVPMSIVAKGTPARHILASGGPFFDSNGQKLGAVSVMRDITQRKQTEEVLRRNEAELEKYRRELQLLTAQLMRAQEDERRRLSRELHDDVNQRLGMLIVDLELLGQKLMSSPDGTSAQLREYGRRISDLSQNIHDMAYQLHPSVLDHLGLVVALRSYVSEWSKREKIKVRFSHRNVPESLDENVATCLYRVAQESLRNAAKHSHSPRVSVILAGSPRQISLSIRDFGVGFDPEFRNERHHGLGIVSMNERVKLVNGRLSLKSKPDEGTRVVVQVPLP